MKIIKRGKVKRTEYLLVDKPTLDGKYTVEKFGQNCRVTLMYSSRSIVNASTYFDNLFKANLEG